MSKNSLFFKNRSGQALNTASAQIFGMVLSADGPGRVGVLPGPEGTRDSQSLVSALQTSGDFRCIGKGFIFPSAPS